MLESNLCLESPRRTLIWCTFELGLEPSLVLQWSFCVFIYDIYMWKNTQLGPLFICFKRREPHKSLGRAECSQKAVDVWIASTASSLRSFPRGWQHCRPAASTLCVAWGGASLVVSPLPPMKSLATGMLQDHLRMEYQKDASFMLPNTSVPFKQPLGLLTACLNNIQCWEASPAVLRFCPISLSRYTHLPPNQLREKSFCSPAQHLAAKNHCFCC